MIDGRDALCGDTGGVEGIELAIRDNRECIDGVRGLWRGGRGVHGSRWMTRYGYQLLPKIRRRWG